MASGTGLLVIWTDIAAEHEAEFNQWYDQEHIPQLLTCRAFRPVGAIVRSRALPAISRSISWLTKTFSKATPSAPSAKLQPPGLRRSHRISAILNAASFGRFSRMGRRRKRDAEFILTVRLNTPADHEKEFNDWYNEDHVPALVGVPGVYCASRYEAVEGDPKYLAVYEMRDGAETKSPEWETARKYGRTAQIRPHLKDLKTVVAQRIFPV